MRFALKLNGCDLLFGLALRGMQTILCHKHKQVIQIRLSFANDKLSAQVTDCNANYFFFQKQYSMLPILPFTCVLYQRPFPFHSSSRATATAFLLLNENCHSIFLLHLFIPPSN